MDAGQWWRSLELLRQHPGLGAASKLAFEFLWHAAGGQPGEIVVSPRIWAAAYGRDPRAARKWLVELAAADLIDVREHDKHRGTVRILVYHPNPGLRDERPDPQARLAFGEEQESGGAGEQGSSDCSDLTAPKGPTATDQSDLSARVCPTSGPKTRAPLQKGPDLSAPKGPTGIPTDREPGGEAPARPRPRASSVRPSVRTTEMEEVNWSEAERMAGRAAKIIPIKSKAAYRDAALLLTAAVLTQAAIPEACIASALEQVRRDCPTNRAAYFRRMLGVEIARHYGEREDRGPYVLSDLERRHPIPSTRIRALLDSLHPPDESRQPDPEPSKEEREQLRRDLQAHIKHLQRRHAEREALKRENPK